MPFLRVDEAPTQAEREKMPEHEFGDPENKKYPLDTPEHVRAAASYVEKEHNAGRLSDAKHKEILARVRAAEKRHGIGEGSKDSRWERVHRLDLASGEMSSYHETQIGGVVARGNLTRTGVLDYRQPDGSVRRELRHPDEVFDPDSLDSLAHATLTDDHPGSKVTPSNWRQESIGHIAGRPKRSGKFVAGEIHIQHGPAIAKAKEGRLQELSCGYECHLDPTPGEYDGERYDAVQRRIRYNHVAAGPQGWGRAGGDVRMRLDAAGVSGLAGSPLYIREQSSSEGSSMTDEEKAALKKAEDAATTANEALAQARKDAADAKTDAEKVAANARLVSQENATLKAENDLLKLQAARQTQDAASSEAAKKREADIQEAIQLRADAASIFRDDKEWKADGKSNEQIKREAIAKMEPDLKLDAKASADTVESLYQLAKSYFHKVRGAGDQLLRVLTSDKKGGEDEEMCNAEDARAEMDRKKRDAWKKNSKFAPKEGK